MTYFSNSIEELHRVVCKHIFQVVLIFRMSNSDILKSSRLYRRRIGCWRQCRRWSRRRCVIGCVLFKNARSNRNSGLKFATWVKQSRLMPDAWGRESRSCSPRRIYRSRSHSPRPARSDREERREQLMRELRELDQGDRRDANH